MATPTYIFTASNGQLVATLDNTGNVFDHSEILVYKMASPHLVGAKIYLFSFGIFQKDFEFRNFGTIGGVTPTTLANAHSLILALIP